VIQFAGDIPSHRQSTTVLKGREKGDYENNKDWSPQEQKKVFFFPLQFWFSPVISAYVGGWLSILWVLLFLYFSFSSPNTLNSPVCIKSWPEKSSDKQHLQYRYSLSRSWLKDFSSPPRSPFHLKHTPRSFVRSLRKEFHPPADHSTIFLFFSFFSFLFSLPRSASVLVYWHFHVHVHVIIHFGRGKDVGRGRGRGGGGGGKEGRKERVSSWA